MHTDGDIAEAIKSLGESFDTPLQDPRAVELKARRRRRAHRLAVGIAGTAVVALAAAVVVDAHQSHKTGGTPSAASPTQLSLRPACEVAATMSSGGSDPNAVLATVSSGAQVSVDAVVTATRPVTLDQVSLVVAKPGAQLAAGAASDLPSAAAELASNQVANATTKNATVDSTLRVTFTAPAPGTYPVSYDIHYSGDTECTLSGGSTETSGPVGLIVVK